MISSSHCEWFRRQCRSWSSTRSRRCHRQCRTSWRWVECRVCVELARLVRRTVVVRVTDRWQRAVDHTLQTTIHLDSARHFVDHLLSTTTGPVPTCVKVWWKSQLLFVSERRMMMKRQLLYYRVIRYRWRSAECLTPFQNKQMFCCFGFSYNYWCGRDAGHLSLVLLCLWQSIASRKYLDTSTDTLQPFVSHKLYLSKSLFTPDPKWLQNKLFCVARYWGLLYILLLVGPNWCKNRRMPKWT